MGQRTAKPQSLTVSGYLKKNRDALGYIDYGVFLFMATPVTAAPDLLVQAWFNTDRPLSLSALRGKVVVLAAFQVLCPTSIASGVPQARRIYETFAPDDVTVIGIHTTFEHHDAFNTAVLKACIHEYCLKFPIALDQPNPTSPIPLTMERYQMRGTPSLVLIDRRGMVRKHAFGAVEDLRIGAEIGALTQEPESVALSSRQAEANSDLSAHRHRFGVA